MIKVALAQPWWLGVAVATLASGGCAARRTEGWRAGPAQASGASTAEFEAAHARAMAHWANRDSLPELRAAIEAMEDAYRLNPTHLENAALISRAHYLTAEILVLREAPEEEWLAAYQTGIERGERALAINSGFREAMGRGSLDDALQALDRRHVPALYWTAVNLGRWSRAKGFMTILANRSRVQKMVQRVTELDSVYFYAAPDRYWGAYYAIAPSIAGGDKNKSRMHFERALRIEPNYVGTRVTFAEAYARGVQDRVLFEEQLRLALETPETVIPEIAPEQRIEKAKARLYLTRVDEWFAR